MRFFFKFYYTAIEQGDGEVVAHVLIELEKWGCPDSDVDRKTNKKAIWMG